MSVKFLPSGAIIGCSLDPSLPTHHSSRSMKHVRVCNTWRIHGTNALQLLQLDAVQRYCGCHVPPQITLDGEQNLESMTPLENMTTPKNHGIFLLPASVPCQTAKVRLPYLGDVAKRLLHQHRDRASILFQQGPVLSTTATTTTISVWPIGPLRFTGCDQKNWSLKLSKISNHQRPQDFLWPKAGVGSPFPPEGRIKKTLGWRLPSTYSHQPKSTSWICAQYLVMFQINLS